DLSRAGCLRRADERAPQLVNIRITWGLRQPRTCLPLGPRPARNQIFGLVAMETHEVAKCQRFASLVLKRFEAIRDLVSQVAQVLRDVRKNVFPRYPV